jgi:Heparinase II/III-like protein
MDMSAAPGTEARDPFFTLAKTHPRIMATPAAIDRVKAAIANSDVGQKLKGKIFSQATEILPEPPVVYTKGDLLDQARTALKRLQTLGMAWLLDPSQTQYVARAKAELMAIAGFPDWNPGHFLDTAEMTHAASIGFDWFYGQWSDAERATVAAAIVTNGLTPGLAQLTGNPDPAWPSRVTNWNIVCNGGLMIGALAVGEASSDITRQVFRRCLDSVPTGFCGYAPDGSWDEGPGYWTYATEYASYLLSALKTAVGHEFALGDLPGVRNTGMFRLHMEGAAAAGGQAALLFNFSDSPDVHSGSWCMRWLSLRYDRPVYNWVALNDNQHSAMDLLWFSPDAPDNGHSIPRNALFGGVANVAVLRGKSTSAGTGFRPWEHHHRDVVYVATRAGGNSTQNHHGHLDLGGFVLDAEQLRWACDLAPVDDPPPGYLADYDLPGYFDITLDQRFRYYRTGTIGHNTLLVNGQNQPLDVQTDVVAFAATLDLVIAVADLSAAYPDCLRVRRGFALIRRRHVLIVDEVTPKLPLTLTWQMHTRATAAGGRVARLTQPNATGATTEFFAQVLEPASVAFQVQPATVTQPKEAPNTGVCKLVATLPNIADPTRLAVQLSTQAAPLTDLPAPLSGPLWSWIAWAGAHRRQNGGP